MRFVRILSIGVAALAAVLLAGGCGNTQSGDDATAASQGDAVREINITVAGDEITPSLDVVEVAVDTTVRITVTSDEADELHVHGYEKSVEPAVVDQGMATTIEFVADQIGLFYVELHYHEMLLFQLLVR